ncbi:hypothetical protein ABH931_005316 [Streptacidiphilus sp. MAP12-33]|uniref:condensation domain-containing protein n=1 Tax=Streptacidiphilus sp. MAP12-33 TaxID=3156266 RepID=UPI0035157717
MSPVTGAALPLTVIQESMWTAYRLAPDSAAYNIVMPLRLRGPLDRAAMERAVAAVGARHGLLRSVFAEQDGEPVRFESVDPLVRLEYGDLDGAGEAELHKAAEEIGARPFRLDAAPFRVALLRRGDEDHALVTSAHHIVSDFASRWLLVRDLLDAYAGFAGGGEPGWREIPGGGYGDHAAEERRYLGSESGARAAERWRDSLAGAPAAELPLDRPRPAVRSLRGDTVVRRLPAGTSTELEGAANSCSATPFAFLLGVFQALTHRWTGQPEFALGVPATSRMGRAQRDVVGCFLNTFPLRAAFGPVTTFRETVKAAGEGVMQGLLGVRYPAALAFPQSGAFHMGLFLVQMDRMEPPVPNVPAGAAEGPPVRYAGLDLALIDVPQQEGQLDLLLRVEQTSEGLTLVLSYDTDVLDRTTVERLADGYERLLAAAAADPDALVADADLTGAAELDALLALGSGGTDYDEFEAFESAWDYR